MKSQRIFHTAIYISLLIFSVSLLSIGHADAKSDAKQERVRMKLYYSKNDAGERMFSIGLTAGSGKNMHGVKNAKVQLTSILNDSTIVLAILETDTSGIVNLYLDNEYVLPMNEDGITAIEAVYEGNDVYRSASSDIEISDIEFDFNFEIEDSVKYLNITATRLDKEGNIIPVEELGINIGIQRLYSVLPIDEVETDEDGIGVMEIPNDLPGDADGLLTFVARIEDHDEFGTVVKTASHTWGTPVSYEVKPLPRQLFTDEAPLWMISCVFIILLGAWYHFFLSISKLIKLKKSA